MVATSLPPPWGNYMQFVHSISVRYTAYEACPRTHCWVRELRTTVLDTSLFILSRDGKARWLTSFSFFFFFFFVLNEVVFEMTPKLWRWVHVLLTAVVQGVNSGIYMSILWILFFLRKFCAQCGARTHDPDRDQELHAPLPEPARHSKTFLLSFPFLSSSFLKVSSTSNVGL